ncbi:hypothetical protein B0H13DRAFT_1873338 [Mycena leptocephala]|nr:hypothetical protein B0H13DRAFT_1873338 [Mycena leptocephala]
MKLARAYTVFVVLATGHALAVNNGDAPGLDLTPKYSPLDMVKPLGMPAERRARLPSQAGNRLPPQSDIVTNAVAVAADYETTSDAEKVASAGQPEASEQV